MAEREGCITSELRSSKDDEEEEREDSEDESEVELEEGEGVSELRPPAELRTGSSCSETLAAPCVNQSSENGRSDGRFVGNGIDSVLVDGLFSF